MKYSGIGGQAVIEGIMMQNGENYAVAVRKPDGEIEVKKDTYRSVTKKYPFLGIPFIRGVFKFADSMIVGMRALTWSCSFFEDDEDAKESRFEQWLDKVFRREIRKHPYDRCYDLFLYHGDWDFHAAAYVYFQYM